MKTKGKIGILLVGLLLSQSSGFAQNEKLFEETLKYVQQKSPQQGIDKYTKYCSDSLKKTQQIAPEELQKLARIADCIRFMELTKKVKPSPKTAAWFFASPKRLHSFVHLITPQDNLKKCFQIIEKIRTHDPDGSNEYDNLVLALGVVMDSHHRSIHGQMGMNVPKSDNNPIDRYDYFKTLYAKSRAKMGYKKLTARDLCFVVHTPVPISELEWACKNIHTSLSGWKTKVYNKIDYDHDRLEHSQYTWDAGTYTLKSIKKEGGICVDQAYFALITARAYGIPSIYFHGSGNSGNHAWFGFMLAPGKWELDVGRYQNAGYVTGFAIDPQTNQQMTDHDVKYMCERSLRSGTLEQAITYTDLAEVLQNTDPKNALYCTKMARKTLKRFLQPWEIEQHILTQQKNYKALYALFLEKKTAFKNYPDILAKTAKEIGPLLRKNGLSKEADQITKKLKTTINSDRDDLQRDLKLDRVKQIAASGDNKKARKELEKILKSDRNEANKLYSTIRYYLKFTRKTGQTHEAVRFLKSYISRLASENDELSVGTIRTAYSFLITAYENDGQKKKAEKLKQKNYDNM